MVKSYVVSINDKQWHTSIIPGSMWFDFEAPDKDFADYRFCQTEDT